MLAKALLNWQTVIQVVAFSLPCLHPIQPESESEYKSKSKSELEPQFLPQQTSHQTQRLPAT